MFPGSCSGLFQQCVCTLQQTANQALCHPRGSIVNLKAAIPLTFAVICFGCGTATTVGGGDFATKRNLVKMKTYCETIPRVYSGVFYDLCVINTPPAVTNKASAVAAVYWAYPDLMFSGFFDTVVLPYTAYRQSVDGAIQIH